YGQFTFKDNKPVQIWVAGGIGITPFIARLQYLAQHPEQRAIYFFYSTDKTEPNVMDRLTSVAKTAGINFHLQLASRDGRLTADFIREKVPNWQTASLWFCGPAGFGDALHANFKAQGLKDSDFHQELFEFR
ncbi:MAG TPA: ferric reductase, partial [Thiolinea sp.]|nr:ferric reductase [Thiolinea sp.]